MTDYLVTLKIKVIPGASRTEISGWLGDALKVRVSAPPEKGKANAAVVALLAKVLEVSANSITIIAGAGSQQKVIEIRGLSNSEVLQKLGGRDLQHV